MATLIILSIVALALWLFQIVFSILFHRKEQNVTAEDLPPPSISVVMPVYNEVPENVYASLRSILAQQQANIEVIVVDDGSDEPVKLDDFPTVKLIRMPQNVGKRRAQMAGVEQAQYDWIATVDSDTNLDPKAMYYLYAGTVGQQVDAITGSIFVANRKQNLLTKVVSCMYGVSIFQHRAEQALFGTVTCCSGALSLYNKSVMLQHKDDYVSQTFLGRPCMAGDDRHMTSLFILSGHHVGWTSRARCWTKIPHTVAGLIKQQIRWVRSHTAELTFLIRRTGWTLPFAFFAAKLLFNYIYRGVMFVALIAGSFVGATLLPLALVAGGVLGSLGVKIGMEYIWASDLRRTETSKFRYLLSYAFFDFFVLTPVIAYAMLTPHKVGWLTRGHTEEPPV